MAEVYLSLGSNIGRRPNNVKKAVVLLDECGLVVEKMSGLYETAPVSKIKQRYFINACIKVNTDFLPQKVLRIIQNIEKEMGRDRLKPKHKGYERARIIDIDILLYDNLVINKRNLKIPHPEMKNRSFVLQPLADIAPGIVRKLTL
ncbi:2-amino-4-hydroxy-6-hydroxymethyldihydropteridine diphosphokinase [bacterium]|nr:2-amino-4-hydroxy-6-hydroxymethyldihydropteridine diphosphokinase [bacterium]